MPITPKKEPKKEEKHIPQMPFNDALKRILGAPPQHKTATKKPKQKKTGA